MKKDKIVLWVKRILLFIIFIILYCVLTAEVLNASQIVKIGYLPNYSTIDNIDAFGYEGYGYEFFAEISKYTGHEYVYVPCTIEEGIQMLEDGEIDLMGPFEKTQERMEQFAFPTQDMGSEKIVLCAPASSGIAFQDMEAIKNKRVATMYDYYTEQLDTYLQKRNIPVSYVSSNGLNMVEGIEEGQYDLILASTMFKLPNMKIVLNLENYPLYCVARKDNQELVDKIDKALEKIYQKDLMFASKLYQKYFSSEDYPKQRLSKAQEEILERKKVFTVGFLPDQSPVQYIDKKGNPAGISIDIMNMIAEKADIKLNYVPLKSVDEEEHQMVDINLSYLSQYIDKDHFYVTKPYLELPLSYVGKSGEQVTKRVSIAMPDFAFVNQNQVLRNNEVKVIELNSVEERFWALRNGKVDYAIVSDVSADIILQKAGYKQFTMYPSGINIPLHLMISKSLSPEYVEAFDVLINLLNRNTINASIIQNTGLAIKDKSFLEILYENRVYFSVFLGIVGVVIIVLTLQKQRAMKKVLEIDSLTSFYTERKFLEEGKKLLASAKANQYMLISSDIDDFQYINEVYGYEKGTEVLKEFSKQLSRCYKNNDLIARVTADRFLVLTKAETGGCFCGNDICKGCVSRVSSNILGDNYRLSVSRGIYMISNPNLDLTYMIDCVESARKSSKNAYGKSGGTVTVFTESMEQKRKHIKNIVSSMEFALANREFTLRYQPKVDLQTKKVVGAEALVRWNPENGDMIYPDEFIPIFEENGFIEELDYYVFEEACRFIRKHKSNGHNLNIAVNISGVTLLKDAFTKRILDLIQQYELSADNVEIEITEGVIISNYDEVSSKISMLRENGFKVAMDDFGSGFSSVSRLKDIPVDVLKIDKGVLFDTFDNEKNLVIFRNILMLGKGLDLITVAEGVETKEQAEWLEKEGCNIAQGYYFAKPMTEMDFLNYLEVWQRGGECDEKKE